MHQTTHSGGVFISEYANGQSGDQRQHQEEMDSTAGCGGAPLQGRQRHPARGDSNEPDAVRPKLKSLEEAPEVGVTGTECWSLEQNAKPVEKRFAQSLHTINTGTVHICVELVVTLCLTKPG